MRETGVQDAICQYLTLKGYFFSRTNNGATWDPTKKLHRSLPKYTRKGWPDICLIHAGKFYGIEVKTDVGRLSPEQQELGSEIIANGGFYIVARSIDDMQAAGL